METTAYEMKAEILRILAQPTRLKILKCLRGGHKYISEIVLAINGDQCNISRHICLMQKKHLVTRRKDGVRVIVSVKDPKTFDILGSISLLFKRQILEIQKLVRKLG